MAAFTYEAINAQGLRSAARSTRPTSSRRASSSARAACCRRRCRSGRPAARAATARFKKVKPRSLQVFSRQLATMIEAGVNVVQRVRDTRGADRRQVPPRRCIAEIRSDVEAGMILSQAFARHPKVFNRLFVAMIEAGESSGTLDTVLDRARDPDREGDAIKRRVKCAMVYPLVVLTLRHARPHLHAHVHRPGLREGLRRPRRRAAEADADRDRHVERAARLLVHHLPG